ncbi:PREDICTED: 2'-5'-oligoadenylate synthase-like protein 2, partial [Chlamydotis macqueenii]|uniref:2'-5'-oligoadenylate synthase-like protein 2 n=1 Tax=Chlamydotis macqueenii TaxID=187382 RepID=UPI000529AB5D
MAVPGGSGPSPSWCGRGAEQGIFPQGGSAGKGTALQNNSDADVVLFLSCFSSYQQQKQGRHFILDLIKRRLHACRQSLMFTVNISEPRYKGPSNTPRSLSLTLRSKQSLESIDVDILPAYDALGKGCKLLKNLLRLVKHWYKEPQYPSANLPPKYALELLTIYAWEEGTGSRESFIMAEGFRTVLEL